MSNVVIAGNICLDIMPDFNSDSVGHLKSVFVPGHLTTIGNAHFSSGGCVSNTGIAFQKLGINTKFMGKIGDDIFGKILIDLLAKNSPDVLSGMIVDNTADTSYSIILNPPGIDRIIFHNPGANDTFSVKDIDFNSISNAQLFHFGYPPLMRHMYVNNGFELVELFSKVKCSGVTTSLDMSLPDPLSDSGKVEWKKLLQSLLPYVDIFLPSIDEIVYMLKSDKFWGISGEISSELLSSIGKELLEMGAKIVVLKLGDRGLYIRTASLSKLQKLGNAKPCVLSGWEDREIHIPCFKVEVRGTTGAGDTTIAGFLAAFLRGMSISACATMAVAVGACCVESMDATSGIRSWEETMYRVEKGWQRTEDEIKFR